MLPPGGRIGNCGSVGYWVGNGVLLPGGGIGNCSCAGVQGEEWGCCPWWRDWELQPCWGNGCGMGMLPPGGGIGNCSRAGVPGGKWGCCPLLVGLGIAAVQGSGGGNGAAAPWWWDSELQLCWGHGWRMGVLPPGGGMRSLAVGGRGVWGDPRWEWGVLRGPGVLGVKTGARRVEMGAPRGLGGVWGSGFDTRLALAALALHPGGGGGDGGQQRGWGSGVRGGGTHWGWAAARRG